ncbi:HTH domain-containing protein [Croceimicrobium hydrocarbonivorans]|uniref:HTH domain-containing protein n=1 Tax=Croceimicrobium hydrocarbonivorans TaxID=2761580 RepID=A0A7H0VIW6_9FLAO|nr:HTH domain-containing protein [Croceimicrobium hydrocarbonivorans]
MDYITYQSRLSYIVELLEKEAVVTPVGMSEKYECSTKTINRMIAHLRESGYNIKWCRKRKSYCLSV